MHFGELLGASTPKWKLTKKKTNLRHQLCVTTVFPGGALILAGEMFARIQSQRLVTRKHSMRIWQSRSEAECTDPLPISQATGTQGDY